MNVVHIGEFYIVHVEEEKKWSPVKLTLCQTGAGFYIERDVLDVDYPSKKAAEASLKRVASELNKVVVPWLKDVVTTVLSDEGFYYEVYIHIEEARCSVIWVADKEELQAYQKIPPDWDAKCVERVTLQPCVELVVEYV